MAVIPEPLRPAPPPPEPAPVVIAPSGLAIYRGEYVCTDETDRRVLRLAPPR